MSLVALVVYSTALSTCASILRDLPVLSDLLVGEAVFAPVHHLSLVLDQDGDVHEHLVQLLDRLLQLDEHLVSKEQILGQL